MSFLLIAGLIVGLLLIPIGMGGLWVMTGIVVAGYFLHMVSLTTVAVVVGIALFAELIEFAVLGKYTKKFGGSRKAFWGALVGGFAGVVVGAPIPIIGSIVAGFIGSFLGAAAVTVVETKDLGSARRVGFGAMVGRAMSAVTKTAAGLAILVLGAAAFLK